MDLHQLVHFTLFFNILFIYFYYFNFLIVFYGLCYYGCPEFPPFAPLHPAPPLPQAVPPLFTSTGREGESFGCPVSCTALRIAVAIL